MLDQPPLERARSRNDPRGLRNMDKWNLVRCWRRTRSICPTSASGNARSTSARGRSRSCGGGGRLAFFKEPPVLPELALFVPEGPGYRAVTRHAHIVEVSRHPEIYQSGKGATSIPDMPEELLEYFGSMVNTDNPRHAQLRRIVSAAFSPRMIKSIEDRIEFVANEVIDRIATEGGCDFVVDVAPPLPLEIICGMMGLGPADYGTVLRASNVIPVSGNAIAGSGDPEYLPADADPLVALMEASQSLTTLMSELAEARRS